MTFAVGQRVRFRATFKDESGRPLDPSAITCRVSDDRGTITYTTRTGIQRRTVGDYYLDVTLETAGTVVVRFDDVGDQAWKEERYEVSGVSDTARPTAPAPRADEPEAPAPARAMLLAHIREAGIQCDETRSDAYLSAVLAEHRRYQVEKVRLAAEQKRRG